MLMRRSPRGLPGVDPWLLLKIIFPIYLFLLGVMLALDIATATLNDTRGGHLPWPLVQWALTTPLGVLAVAVVGGLLWTTPLWLITLARPAPLIAYPMDVTGLPPEMWPRPPSLWRAPVGWTLADTWLGRGRSQRAVTLLSLALAALLLLGMVAGFIAAAWYGLTHFALHCGPSGCSPSYLGQLSNGPEFVGLTILFLATILRVVYVERRCGVWFRVRDILDVLSSSFGTYIRRPGVTPEAAATALQRYTRDPRRPLARSILMVTLALLPAFLMLAGSLLLATWLSTQWIPA